MAERVTSFGARPLCDHPTLRNEVSSRAAHETLALYGTFDWSETYALTSPKSLVEDNIMSSFRFGAYRRGLWIALLLRHPKPSRFVKAPVPQGPTMCQIKNSSYSTTLTVQ